MSITLPPSLEGVDKAFDLIKNIISLDSKSVKAIEENIRNFHSLNDAEKKKAEEARNLLSQYQNLVNVSKETSAQLALEREATVKERRKFDLEKQSQLDDIAVKRHHLSIDTTTLERARDNFEEVKRQIGIAQTAVDEASKRHLEREKSFAQKEQDLESRQKQLDAREGLVKKSEADVKQTMSELKQAMRNVG